MANLNQINLIGRATRDVEIRYTPEGKALGKFGLAVNKFGKDKGASFFNVVAWDKKAETLAQYLKKGHLVYISGRMESNEVTNDKGEKRIFWDVTVNDFQFLQAKDASTPDRTGPVTEDEFPSGSPEGSSNGNSNGKKKF